MYRKSNVVSKFSIFSGIFFLQFILFFPLNFLNDFQLKITYFLFGDSTEFLLQYFFDKKNFRIDYSSDSCSMLVLVIILLSISAVFSFILKKETAKYFLLIIEYFCIVYISVILIKYGIDKIFKTQFPEPESNILFTRFGNLDKDLLYWSTIGTSKIYNSIMGSLELFSGILLLFRRSQFSGLLLAIISFTQILIINIGFDISVKFFSLILLLMSLFLARKNRWKLLLKIIDLPTKTFFDRNSFLPYKTFFKILIVGIVLINIGMPYLNTYFDTEDKKNSSNLAGVYQVTSPESPFQYLFFHKDHYLIFMERSSEKMSSFHYDISADNQIILEDNEHHIYRHLILTNQNDGTIIFSFRNQIIEAKSINIKKMNALQDKFHLLVDY